MNNDTDTRKKKQGDGGFKPGDRPTRPSPLPDLEPGPAVPDIEGKKKKPQTEITAAGETGHESEVREK